jgi:hypothetical protein
MGLSFTIVAGPRQRIYFWVRVPWDSRPYFTLSDSRFPFSSPPTTRRATVEVFDPAFTRELKWTQVKVKSNQVKVTLGLSRVGPREKTSFHLVSKEMFVDHPKKRHPATD